MVLTILFAEMWICRDSTQLHINTCIQTDVKQSAIEVSKQFVSEVNIKKIRRADPCYHPSCFKLFHFDTSLQSIQKVTFAMKDIFKLFCNSKMYFNHWWALKETFLSVLFFHWDTGWCWGLGWDWVISLRANRCAANVLHVKLPRHGSNQTVLHSTSHNRATRERKSRNKGVWPTVTDRK